MLPPMERRPVRQRSWMVELQRRRDTRGQKFHLQPTPWPFRSPVQVLDSEVFWGKDRLDLLEDALKSGRAPYSSRIQNRLERAAAIEEMMPS